MGSVPDHYNKVRITRKQVIGILGGSQCINTSLVAQKLKRLTPVRETWVQSLGQEDPLEKEMATPPVFLLGESHGQRSLVGYSPRGCKESDTIERLHFHFQCIIKLCLYYL